MRVFYLANNELGLRVAEWLRGSGHQVVGLVVHEKRRARLANEIQQVLAVPDERTWSADQLGSKELHEAIRALDTDVGLSVLLGYRVPRSLLDVPRKGIVNLHTGYLPYNRGAYPNVWPIIDGTPAGATLHLMDEGFDTGPVIAQTLVDVDPADTGKSLYVRLNEAAYTLLTTTFDSYVGGTLEPRQQTEPGSVRMTGDVASIDEVDLDRVYLGRDLIDLIRARTFPPYPGAYFRDADGRRIHLRLELTPEAREER